MKRASAAKYSTNVGSYFHSASIALALTLPQSAKAMEPLAEAQFPV